MIISRTPFRISFFGGGTDYPAWYRQHGGAVLSTTIDKYCWITCRHLPPFFDHKSRIIHSLIENVKSLDEIKHPSARECLRFLDIRDGIEIHHDGDLPARTGLGSSSSFTVGLLHALRTLRGDTISKQRLASDAIHVEQDLIRENVGAQDQVAAAFGGLNLIRFQPDSSFDVQPVLTNQNRLTELQNCLMLFYTGISRIASEIAAEQVKNVRDRTTELHAIRAMVDDALQILAGNTNLDEFGRLLHTGWEIKKKLSSRISTPEVNDMYDQARQAGALGGKLLGAGGGGFMLFFVRPERQEIVRRQLKDYLHVPFQFEKAGSQLVFAPA